MEIPSNIKTYSDVKAVEQTASVEKNDGFNKLLETQDLSESEYKKLTYEEAKALQLEREKEGKYVTKDTPGYSLGFGEFGSALLQVTTLTDDEAFNKAAFETMKQKDIPAMYLTELKNNMDYDAGRRKHPHGAIDVSELYGNPYALSRSEMNQIDLDAFLQNMINTYTQLLSSLPSYLNPDETQQSLDDLTQIQQNYNKNKEEQNRALEQQMSKGSNINPLHYKNIV
jgi:hypothetical protein